MNVVEERDQEGEEEEESSSSARFVCRKAANGLVCGYVPC